MPIFQEITRRLAAAGDLDFLWDLHISTMRSYVEQTWGWDEAFQRDFFDEHFKTRPNEILEINGLPIGLLEIETHHDLVILKSIAIDPTFQRQGIATNLIQKIIGEAAASGRPVQLQVLKVNPAKVLYERLGFIVYGETATHHLMRTSSPDPQFAPESLRA